jgi:hypothetical protein
MEKIKNDFGFTFFKLGLGWLNVYLFLRILSLATNFARIYSNAYGKGVSEVLTVIFFIAFFLIFRNLGLIIKFMSVENYDESRDLSTRVAKYTIFVMFLLVILQMVPEFLLTLSYQNQ